MKLASICVIGLGYVGLPLAIEFGKKYRTVGFDLKKQRIDNLKNKIDTNSQIKKKEFIKSKKINFSYNKSELKSCNIFIIAVPTPVKKNKTPDLRYLKDATELVAKYLKPNDCVIYESTVYPGTTEEICVPILKKFSKLKTDIESNKNSFSYGFSPERLNPGSKEGDIRKIVKVVSGSTKKSSIKINNLYKSIITAGTYKAGSVKVAEAAKIIENTQRDVNIALINEFQKIFTKMNLNIYEVLKASETKWNFLKFKPGMVGGHCISVDPYYLSYKAKKIGVSPKMVLSGRETNSMMPKFYCDQILSYAKNKKNIKILVLGLTFKENCPDIRNSGSIEMCKIFLKKRNVLLHSHDQHINKEDYNFLEKINYIKNPKKKYYDIIVVAVAHKIFKNLKMEYFRKYLKNTKSIIIDIKDVLGSSIKKKVI